MLSINSLSVLIFFSCLWIYWHALGLSLSVCLFGHVTYNIFNSSLSLWNSVEGGETEKNTNTHNESRMQCSMEHLYDNNRYHLGILYIYFFYCYYWWWCAFDMVVGWFTVAECARTECVSSIDNTNGWLSIVLLFLSLSFRLCCMHNAK